MPVYVQISFGGWLGNLRHKFTVQGELKERNISYHKVLLQINKSVCEDEDAFYQHREYIVQCVSFKII